MNLGFSINSTRYCASLSAAVARSSAALSAWRCAMMSACAPQGLSEANHQGLLAMMDSQAGCAYELAIAPLFTMP